MQFAEAKTKMSAIRADLQAEVDTVCANARYSTDGKVHEIAKAILDARSLAVELRDQFVTTSEETRRKLARKLFGLPAGADPATVLVYRDAEDRAAKITDPDEYGPLMARALDRGDDLMARAIAARADTQGITDVAAAYAAGTGQTGAYTELDALPTGRNFNTAVAMVFTVPLPALPTELASIIRTAAPSILTADDTAGQLRKLAETPPANATKPTSRTYRPGSLGTVAVS
ncbi:hypothetical protein [Mycobacterium sp. SMC-19]|uniref:hypothetical protein n=1 Tax=Mycobacterium sp. SMC-19 TaxID=3381630 RepID=UPI003875F140